MTDSATIPSLTPSLLARAQESDEAAWQRIVEVFGPFVYRTLLARHVPASEVSDLMQEVFVSVYRNIGRFRRTLPSSTFRGWLYRIACNEANDYFRERDSTLVGFEHPSALAEPEPEQEPGDTPDERLNFVHRIIEAVRGDFQESTFRCFWGSRVEGIDTRTLMDELGMSASAVREARRRVWKRVREECRELLGFDPEGKDFSS